MSDILYNSKQELVCREFPTLRSLGVRVGEPFQHHGRGMALYADVEYERPTVNAVAYGSKKPVAELNTQIIEGTRRVIAGLDTIIAEFQEHRDRLQAELERIEKEPPVDTGAILLNGLPLFKELSE